jgi:phage head maturation protease
LVAKRKGENLQTSLGFRVLQGGEDLVAKRKGKKLTNKFRV